MRRYYLSLGSNIEPEANLAAAVRLLGEHGRMIAVSSVYISEPFGGDLGQPDYLNAVVVLDSALEPDEFHREVVRRVEAHLGRVRTRDRYAARTIDVDILMVDGDIRRIGRRPIPSPEILERPFVAVPLAEVAPDVRHPLAGLSMAEIAAGFAEDLRVHSMKLVDSEQ